MSVTETLDVPAADDAQCPAAEAPVRRPKLTISALGGRSAEVDAGGYAALVQEMGGVGAEFDRNSLGALIERAKMKSSASLLDALLHVRDDAAPLYRVRNAWGRGWTGHTHTAPAAVVAENITKNKE